MVDKTTKSIYEKILQAEKDTTIEEIIDQENSKQIRVHMPCKVKEVHGATVDVEIQGQEDTGYGYYHNFPLLLDIPILYNNYTSSAYIITPIQEGDTGLVEFLDFNATNFINEGSTELTSDSFYHSLNNGTFINGFIPINKQIDIPINKPIVIGLKNQTFTLDVTDTGELNINSLNNINIASKGNINLNAPITNCSGSFKVQNGATGSFQAGNKNVTVINGIIVGIE